MLVELKHYDRDTRSAVSTFLDTDTRRLFADREGVKYLRTIVEEAFLLGDGHRPILQDGARIHVSQLANAAAEHMYSQTVALTGCAPQVAMLDDYGHVACDDKTGRLITMDLGIGDVHTAAALPNYAGGYHIADGIADAVSPVILVTKAQNIYYTWNASGDFNRRLGVATAPGAAVGMINPTLGPMTYTTAQYGLGGYMPTEVLSNADAPLQPLVKMTHQIIDGLRLEREVRVAGSIQTSGNWNANLVTTIASGAQWDGGAASDPIAVIHAMQDATYMDITAFAWSSRLRRAFLRNPAVQKFIGFKDRVKGLPDMASLCEELGIPDFYEGTMKYTTGGAISYVWGNHLVGVRRPAQVPVANQMDIQTHLTFRWNGGEAPDGSQTGGILVRSFFDQKQGPRGSTVVIATHNDTEVQTSGLVGGLVLNAWQ